ncbi:MAG: HAMP domain-containing histidine kinase [Chromatiaceae bacterium]|nr:HAMP domain-containing histidine kinase [Chromatiaceae bacterium]
MDGVDRATHSVEQLLLLRARDAAQIRVRGDATVNLRDLVVQVVSALSQQAFERDIDLGVDAPVDVMVRAAMPARCR